LIKHAGLSNHINHVYRTFSEDIVKETLLSTPLWFDQMLTEQFAPPLFGGCSTWTASIFDLELFPTSTLIVSTPSLLQAVRNVWPKTLKGVVVGGEPCPMNLVNLLYATCGNLIGVWNSFGPTEVTDMCCFPKLLPHTPVVAGEPLSNTRLYVVNGQGEELGVGRVGELYVAGVGLGHGYTREGLTKERFFAWKNEDMIYATGDLVHWTMRGQLVYHGREDDLCKFNGLRFTLAELESALLTSDAVSAAAVAIDREKEKIRAFVVSASSDPADIRAGLQILPSSIRRAITVEVVPRLPQNANGKVDRASLLKGSRASPDTVLMTGPLESGTIAGSVMDKFVGIFARLSGTRVDVGTDLSSLGLSSLQMFLAYQEAKDAGLVQVPFLSFFEMGTPSELAAHLGTPA
jgi:acyl-CoA synthetase (AMP-forming)/AMP-acid ligase II